MKLLVTLGEPDYSSRRQVRIADRDQFLPDTYPLALDIINVGEGYDVRTMYPAKTIPVQKLLEPLQADLREQGLAIDTVYLYIIAVSLEEKDLFPAKANDLAALRTKMGRSVCSLLSTWWTSAKALSSFSKYPMSVFRSRCLHRK